jgi:hypothetical protein
LLITALLLAGGCAPARYRIAGEEARSARELFERAYDISFPIEASYSGVAEYSGRVIPFIAGVNSRTDGEETVGIYDPMGRGVLFLSNDGKRITASRGPAAADFPPRGLPPLQAGPVSLGRILCGAPGYPVSRGEPARTEDGGWVLEDGRQRLFSDPPRRVLSRAEYEFPGRSVVVSYPGREDPGPPPVVKIEVSGARIVLRRDAE